MNTCDYALLLELLSSAGGGSCNIPQPLEVTGSVETNINIPQPLDVNCDVPQPFEIKGTIDTNVSGTIDANITQPLTITGTINTVSTDACAEGMAKILGQSSSFNEIILQNGEQFQNAEDVSVNGSIVSFTSQNQKIQTTLCNIEYVVL